MLVLLRCVSAVLTYLIPLPVPYMEIDLTYVAEEDLAEKWNDVERDESFCLKCFSWCGEEVRSVGVLIA